MSTRKVNPEAGFTAICAQLVASPCPSGHFMSGLTRCHPAPLPNIPSLKLAKQPSNRQHINLCQFCKLLPMWRESPPIHLSLRAGWKQDAYKSGMTIPNRLRPSNDQKGYLLRQRSAHASNQLPPDFGSGLVSVNAPTPTPVTRFFLKIIGSGFPGGGRCYWPSQCQFVGIQYGLRKAVRN